jgi:uncharacterized protein (DUF2141 family)
MAVVNFLLCCYTWGALMLGLLGPTDTGILRLKITNVRSDRGKIQVCLYHSKDGFPSDPSKSIKRANVIIRAGVSEVVFSDLPPGEYAVALMHDENGNGKMDTNWVGIPKEGYGASNDAKATFGPPKYNDAKFVLNANEATLQIKVRYF